VFGCGTCYKPWHYNIAFSNPLIPSAIISTNEVFITGIWFASQIQYHQKTSSASLQVKTSTRECSKATPLATLLVSSPLVLPPLSAISVFHLDIQPVKIITPPTSIASHLPRTMNQSPESITSLNQLPQSIPLTTDSEKYHGISKTA